MLCAKGRLELPQATQSWRADLIAAGLVEFPVDGEIAVLAAELDGLHGDPADRFIAATAIQRGATLLTGDARLLAWKHRVKRQDARK
jgi:PIN domain nuclease of toxin-antitoxin system